MRSLPLSATMVVYFVLFLWVILLVNGAPPSQNAASPAAKHTRLTGFGSHSVTKSIFAKEKLAPTKKRPTLLVQISDNGLLWFQSRLEEQSNATTICVSASEDGIQATVCSSEEKVLPDDKKWIPVEGLYGVYQVPSGTIWVLITSSQETYTAPPEKDTWWQIRRVNSLELVHIPKTDTQISQRQLKEEGRQLRLLRYALRHHNFYYVPSSSNLVVPDMTHTLQRSLEMYNETKPPWWNSSKAQPDSRFFWNELSVQPLVERRDQASDDAYHLLLQHVIPVASAFVGVQQNVTLTNSTSYDQILISRRSRFRAGTRFTKRGADGTGAVANYAETEQVCLQYDDKKRLQQVQSHVQTRGSIPLRWSSPADVKTYRPRVRIGTDPLAQARAVRSHIMDEFSLYANEEIPMPKNSQLVFVNLIDKQHDQGRLGRAFDAVLQAVLEVHAAPGVDESATSGETSSVEVESESGHSQWTLAPDMVRHIWFDFHAECKGGRWGRLENLLKDVSPTLEEQGYFCAIPPNEKNSTWTVVCRQRGVVRTNCMDCLDRTNVVQSIFGRYMLFRQLYERPGPTTEPLSKRRTLPVEYASTFRRNPMTLPWSTGEVSHRLLWADNADAISRLYAGTPALKGDFTRTGKRTKRGALDDGMNSLQRYYLNNFLDADRQEGMDLLVGYTDFAVIGSDSILLDTGIFAENSGMSIQEAARAIMLRGVTDVGSDDERHHVRIKPKPNQSRHRLQGIGICGANSAPSSRRPLDLRWLPGDLQSHMRSQAAALGEDPMQSSSAEDDGFSTTSALEAIDRRAALDQPWWVSTDSSDEETDTSNKQNLSSSSANVGHLIGGLIAAIQMPLATAAAIMCMLLPGLATPDDK